MPCLLIVYESRHGPEDVDGVVPRAMDVQLRVLHQAFGKRVQFVLDLRRRQFRLFGRGLWGNISHFGHGLVGLHGWAAARGNQEKGVKCTML